MVRGTGGRGQVMEMVIVMVLGDYNLIVIEVLGLWHGNMMMVKILVT